MGCCCRRRNESILSVANVAFLYIIKKLKLQRFAEQIQTFRKCLIRYLTSVQAIRPRFERNDFYTSCGIDEDLHSLGHSGSFSMRGK